MTRIMVKGVSKVQSGDSAQITHSLNSLQKPYGRVNKPFPQSISVRTNNSARTRLGWTFSYIYCIFAHPGLDSVPLLVGMRDSSICLVPENANLLHSL